MTKLQALVAPPKRRGSEYVVMLVFKSINILCQGPMTARGIRVQGVVWCALQDLEVTVWKVGYKLDAAEQIAQLQCVGST